MHEMAKVLELQLQNHSLQRNPRADRLQNGMVVSGTVNLQFWDQFVSISLKPVLGILTARDMGTVWAL